MADQSDVRLSGKEREILRLLIGRGSEMYGLEMVTRSAGELARGTIYVTLSRMEEKGLVSSRREEKASDVSGIPRRLYRPTGYGVRVYRAWEKLQRLRTEGTVPELA